VPRGGQFDNDGQRRDDRIVAETNNGGEMVENTIRMVDPNIPFTAMRASRGKVTRAEPVSALYEQGRMHHIGSFPQLEDQTTNFTSDFDPKAAGYSPDRLDALVWAATELLVTPMSNFGLF
jgi:phage terminase large subunit-like protein